MPQMSPMQWPLFYNMFLLTLIISSILINFINITNNKKYPNNNYINNKKTVLKW